MPKLRNGLLAAVCAIAALADTPPYPQPSWPESTPSEQGIDPAGLEAADQFIRTQCPTRYSLLVIRNGYIVYERYYNGNTVSRLNAMASMTKSFVTALAGIAAAEGAIPSLDRKLADYFPEYPVTDDRKRDITLRHVLTMTSGLQWQEGPDYNAWFSASDWYRFAFTLPVALPAGERFNYNSPMAHLLGGVIMKATGRDLVAYAQEKLFGPLGITSSRWNRDPRGNPLGAYDLYLTSRDLARLGYLYLRKGRWGDQRVVPESWVADSTSPRIPNYQWPSMASAYGYMWWLNTYHGYRTYFMSGSVGQYVFVAPDLDLVVVTAALVPSDNGAAGDQGIALMRDYVIPAVRKGPAAVASVAASAGGVAAASPDSFLTVYGQWLAEGEWTWDGAIPDGKTLPKSLGGVTVRVAGRDCYIQYASPAQVNVLLPATLEPGNQPLEIETPNGHAQTTVTITAISPALFTWPLDGKTYAAAVLADGGVYAGRPGMLLGAHSRAARAGDIVELYAAGMGAPAERHPEGEALQRPFPLANWDHVQLEIGGRPAPVLYVGMTFAGVYQVNVQVPDGTPAGDQSITLRVGTAQAAAATVSIAE